MSPVSLIKRLAFVILIPGLLWAAPETITPNAVSNVSGYVTCVVGDIDEDPDSPDGAWCNVSGASNTNTSVDVDFTTPTNPPTSTASAQQVKVWLRKTNHSTDPTCQVDIIEGATVRVSAVISTTVSSITGSLHSANWTFTPASWTDTTGASIGIDVTCTVGGGSPGSRASGELGAAELNLDTAAAASRKRVIIADD